MTIYERIIEMHRFRGVGGGISWGHYMKFKTAVEMNQTIPFEPNTLTRVGEVANEPHSCYLWLPELKAWVLMSVSGGGSII